MGASWDALCSEQDALPGRGGFGFWWGALAEDDPFPAGRLRSCSLGVEWVNRCVGFNLWLTFKVYLLYFLIICIETLFWWSYNVEKRSVIFMSTETTKDTLPFTCTPAYNRDACKGCVCSTCYEQEFCDRCSSCVEQGHRKERCNAYEGAYNYWASEVILTLMFRSITCSWTNIVT